VFDDRREEMARVHGALRTAGLVAPLDLDDPEDVQRWVHCDLASMVEGCFDVRLDPLALGQAERDAWLGRLRGSYRLPDPRKEDTWNQEWFGCRHWLLDGGARVGTVQIPLTLTARRLVSVNSLYVLPPHRRRGTASRILEALDDAARRQGILGIRIDAHWTWHRSIRFYLARSMWVWSWKREIGLGFDSALPPYRIDVDGEVAEFSIGRDDARQALWRARRAGTRLDLEETTALRRLETNDDDLHTVLCSLATLSVALAARGWPLIRSDAAWAERRKSSDVGQPEGLAYKIEVFEAVARRDGWMVGTPRIPGIAYRDLDDID